METRYTDVIMTTIASQITSLTIVYSTVYSDADQRKTSKLRVTGLCVGNSPGPVNSPHKGPVTRKMFPFDDVIMRLGIACLWGGEYAAFPQMQNIGVSLLKLWIDQPVELAVLWAAMMIFITRLVPKNSHNKHPIARPYKHLLITSADIRTRVNNNDIDI